MNNFCKIEESVELARKKISMLRKDDSLVFPMFTDLHTVDSDHEFMDRLTFALEYISKKIPCDAVINLGDIFEMLGRNIHITNEENESDDTHSKYKENTDLKYLIRCVKEGLKTSKKANVEDIFEIHYFYVPNIGVYKNEMCNFLKVLIVPNTSNIITMYPDRNIEYECLYLKSYIFYFRLKIKTRVS